MAKKGREKEKESAKAAGEKEKGSAVVRTVVVPSVRLSYRTCRALAEVEREYAQMLRELVDFAYERGITSFTKLKAAKYRDMRRKHPDLPSHYAYTACQDASARVKSFLAAKRRGRARTERPEVRNVAVWLDDHLWKPEGRSGREGGLGHDRAEAPQAVLALRQRRLGAEVRGQVQARPPQTSRILLLRL